MSENNLPATKPDPEALPGEFDFAKPVAENPRVRRRSLKTAPASLTPVTGAPPAARELAHEAPPLAAGEPRPPFQPLPDKEDDVATNAAVKMSEPASSRPAATASAASQPLSGNATVRPSSTTTSTQPTSPHGTRPATLYYSTSPRKDKEEPAPMKSTPTASPAPSASSTSSTSPARSAAASVRPSSVVDYRTNVERQAREQKSVGGVLSILVYSLIGLFVVGAGLAGYGAYVVHQALYNQSVTVSQLETRYDAENKDLNTKLGTTLDTLTEAQAQIARQQDLIVKEQEAINRLMTANADNASAIKQEKQARAQETASLRARVKDLEYKGPTSGTSTQKY